MTPPNEGQSQVAVCTSGRPKSKKHSSEIVSHIKPTSELGEFLQHHEPRPPAMPTSIPVAERRVECRIRATTRKRKTDPDVPSILLNSHNRGKRRRNAPPPGHPNATRAFAMSPQPQPTERLPPDPRGEEVTPPE